MSDKIIIGTADEGVVSLDVNKLVDSRMLIQGNSGGGKSWLLRLLCERAAGKVPMIILDPEGEFASLREKVDAVLVGPEGDVPTDLRSAALLARKLVELQISGIIDLYELKPHDRREYVKRFLDALVELPRDLWHPTLVVIDEAHKFAPEKGTGDAVSTQSVINLMSLGRKRGYAGILATQRFSKLHNDTIAETNNVVIGRTWLDADQKRAGEYLGLALADRRKLRDLKPGEFYTFGPAVNFPGMTKFKSDKVATSHPKAGERHKIKPPKASEAIQHIIGQIDDLPAEVEKQAKTISDFQTQAKTREAELKTQIHNLNTQLANAAKPVIQKETVSIIPEEKLTELRDLIDDYFKPFSRALDAAETTAEKIEALVSDIREVMPESKPIAAKIAISVDADKRTYQTKALPVTKTAVRETHVAVSDDNKSLNEGQRRILTAIAQYEGITTEHIAVLTGYKSTSRRVYLNDLVRKGMAVRVGEGFAITHEGLESLGDFQPLPTGDALLDYWLRELPEGEKRIFEVIAGEYPNAVSKEAIADATAYKATSVRVYTNNLAVRRLIEKTPDGIKASDNLF